MPRIRVAAAQLNLVVGDLDGNEARILDAYDRAAAVDADLVAFPELAITGLPARGPAAAAGLRRPGRGDAREDRRPHRRHAAVVGFPSCRPTDALPTRPRSARTARCRASTASTSSRTTRCSTSSATSRRRPSTVRCSSIAGAAGRAHGLRGRVEPDRARHHPGRRRRRARREHQRVAVLRGSRARARDDARRPGRRRAEAPIVYVNLVGGQDELVFDGASMVIDADGAGWSRGRGSSTRTCSSSTSTCGRASATGCSIRAAGWRRRAAARGRGVGEPPRPAGASRRGSSPCSTRCTRCTRRSCSAPATTWTKNGFDRRAHRAVGRHRLVARRRDRRRRARPRQGHRRAHAVALLERGQHHRRRGARARTSASRR